MGELVGVPSSTLGELTIGDSVGFGCTAGAGAAVPHSALAAESADQPEPPAPEEEAADSALTTEQRRTARLWARAWRPSSSRW